MRIRSLTWILAGIMLILDWYVFQAVKTVLHQASPRVKTGIYIFYWLLSAYALVLLFFSPWLGLHKWPPLLRQWLVTLVVGLYLAKLLTVVFLLVDDLRRGLQWIVRLFGKNPPGSDTALPPEIRGITRSQFMTRAGLLVGGGLFATLAYGFSNKYNYRVKRHQLHFPNLPPAFRGLKIVQISDIHSGSFDHKSRVARGVDMVLGEQADVIFFTGDLVNNRADEMKHYQDLFSRIKAPMGVYSTLGNHDYGDYSQWDSPEAKRRNLEHLKSIHAAMGWRLLMNEHVVLEREGQQIAVIGIENWSAKARFPRYGDLKKAYAGAEPFPFKILLSHDPSHWDAQVRPEYPDIDLMLAGHTHGMQFGVEIPGIKWSPIQYMYKEWAGLYNEGRQYLYVNRGYGFLGYPGRVGILPEITVIELV
ncbi:metallophosphoesterase [Compostibacter hankyongensis]|uniref:Metallophosphoesterase n=1 Tax=Compostibacter hankyongensis TaxID=1007089 RepID=A0ABP8FWW3_9BACT